MAAQDISIGSLDLPTATASYPASPSLLPLPIASTSSTLPPPSTTSAAGSSTSSPAQPPLKVHRRGRDGCLSCRRRKKKCTLEQPKCRPCVRLDLECEWEGPEHEEERKRRRVERREEKERREGERRALERLGEEARRKMEREREGLGASSVVENRAEVTADGTGAAQLGAGNGLDGSFPYDPATPALFPSYSAPSPFPPVVPYSLPPASSSWVPFLGSFAPTPAYSAAPDASTVWSAAFPNLVQPEPVLPISFVQPGADAAPSVEASEAFSSTEVTRRHDTASPGLDWTALLRSPSPPAFSPMFILPTNLPATVPILPSLTTTNVAAPSAPSVNLPPPALPQPSIITRATSLLVSADFEFTKAYLLSHYATSLARGVSLASSDSNSRPSTPSGRPSSSSTVSASAVKSANLFLGLIPLAHRHPYVLNAILSWSAANLAVTSSGLGAGTTSNAGGGTEGNSVMSSLSDELGGLAQQELEEALPALQERFRLLRVGRRRGDTATFRPSTSSASSASVSAIDWEPTLAAWIMLVQASICRGDTTLWRLRLRQAANVVSLVGGVGEACKTPLARQLIRNLLYHEVLSRGPGAEEGLLLNYSGLSGRGKRRGGKTSPAEADPSPSEGSDEGAAVEAEGEGVEADAGEEGEAEELDTLMGTAENVFLLIGRITSLAKQKRLAVQQSGDGVAEDALAPFLQSVEEIKAELEEEKNRIDVLMLERPDLAPHRYFHEVFRLAALAFLHMLLELPPRALPMVMLVRKMLSLTEVIVAENLPGLCSMHWCLFIMQLNSTPLISPHSSFGSDRERSSRLFDTQMKQFRFLNTTRSRQLIEEAWRRSSDGRCFVDPDDILAEWKWDLNLA